MTRTTVCGIVLCLISPLLIGCSTGSGVIRAQSPATGPTVQAQTETLGTLYGTNGLFTKHNKVKYEGKITTYTGPNGGQHVHHSGPNGHYDRHHGHANGQPCPQCQQECGENDECRLCKSFRDRFSGPERTSVMGPDGRRYEYPVHTHEFSYKPPQGLVYPENNAPAPVVQYPYYTVKGPDDFFLQ